MSPIRVSLATIGAIALTLLAVLSTHRPAEGDPPLPAVVLGEGPAIREHLSQDEIDLGRTPLATLLQRGRELFVANFNSFDGIGRPEATGADHPVARTRRSAPDNFNRSSGPEANSCAGCHNQPRAGGGGENVA